MNDIALWRSLHAHNLEPDALIEPLEALAARPIAERSPFFGALQPCLEHDDHRLRAAAVRLLGGAQGWLAWTAITRLLHDRAAPVRDAALDALAASAPRATGQWIHALAHPERAIRERALEHVSASLATIHLRMYMLADKDLHDQVRARIEQDGVNARDLRVLLSFVRSGQLPAPTAAGLIAALPWARRGGEIIMGLFSTDDLDPDDTAPHPEALYDLMEQTRTFSAPLHTLLSLFEAPTLVDERDALFDALTEAVRRETLKGQPLRLLGLALLRQALTEPAEDASPPDPVHVALAALPWPTTLRLEAIPLRVRRDAARHIARSRCRARWPDVDALLQADLCRGDAGRPLDLEVTAGVMRLMEHDLYKALLAHLTPEQLTAAFKANPEAAATLFSLPITSGTEPRDRRRLLEIVLGGLGVCSPGLLAQLALELTADGLKELQALLSADELAAARPELLKRAADRHMTDNKRSALAALLVDGTPAHRLAETLEDLARAPEGALRAELLTTLSERAKPRQLLARLEELTPALIAAILDLEASSAALPYAHRRVLVHAFLDRADPRLQRWAQETASTNGDAAPLIHRRDGDAIEALTPKEARRLSRCPEAMLAGHLEAIYATRTRGVCAALLGRCVISRDARLEICLAALVSADPLHAIDAVFATLCDGDVAFMERLRELIVARCVALDGMSPLANAWLHAWEARLSAFEGWCVEQAGLDNALEAALQLQSPQLTAMLWRGVERLIARWRWRSPDAVAARCPEGLDRVLLDVLLGDRGPSQHPDRRDPSVHAAIRRRAAMILANLHSAGGLAKRLATLADAILPRLSELSQELRDALDPWIDSRGVAHSHKGQEIFTKVTPQELETIRRCRVVRKLAGWCRSTSQVRVEEAAFQLMELKGPGFAALTECILVNPPRVRLLIEQTALWPDDAWGALERHLDDPGLPPRVAHLLGVASLQRTPRDATWERVCAALCAPFESGWFSRDDWIDLHALHPRPLELRRRLTHSPHHVIYHEAISVLLEVPPTQETRAALRAFLEAGVERSVSLRRKVAWKLLRDYDDGVGLPVLLVELFEASENNPDTLRVASPAEVHTASRSAAIATLSYRPQHDTLQMLNHSSVPRHVAEPALMELLRASNNPGVQAQVLEALRPRLRRSRQRKLRQMARCFAWGVRRGRELTGALFRVSLITGKALGYTRLESRAIHINPLPMLRGERGGEQVVRALMLHEFGHHVYHADPQGLQVWERASKQRLHQLLNLVADEHLERNLRARNSDDGDALKQLAAYAFQHARREIKVDDLLLTLGFRALVVLRDVEMTPSRSAGSVEVSVGRLLQGLEATGSSFGRFFRALRMGLGDRYGDPKVKEALRLFKRRFRESDMERLFEITLELRRLFADEIQLIDLVGPERCNEANVGDSLIHTDGVTAEELEQAIRDELTSKRSDADSGAPTQTINLGDEEAFARIHVVQPVSYDRASHKALAREVARPARAMRHTLCRLGLSYAQQRRRLQGRQLDRARLQAAVLRGDPRMLIARRLQERSDLFLGIIVDCSGSMRSGQRIERARRFATLIAEATAGLKGVDTRVFGFTDQRIYDAGDARRCAAHALEAGGGNNDAAALWHAAQLAKRSRRSARLLVMISDGSPTECSVAALQGLVARLGRQQICCAQVAVQELKHICFPHYIELLDESIETSVVRFGQIVTRLVRRTLKG